MRIFWGLVAAMVLAGLAYLVVSGDKGRSSGRAGAPAAVNPEGKNAPTVQSPGPGAGADPLNRNREAPSSATGAPSKGDARTPATANAPDANATLDAMLGGTSAEGPGAKDPPMDADRPYLTSPSRIDKRPDGSTLVDGRYVVKGDGTAEHPFEFGWDLLTSVQKTYDPKSARKRIPEGVAMLDAKHVRITGYIAFPLYVQQPRELLAMLNQWDGCCIGVPPTPYDAIEVRLTKPVTGDNRYAASGVVEGVLGIKPYIVDDWLVGLYVLESATMRGEGTATNP